MAVTPSGSPDPVFPLDRDRLRAELIALYHQYRTDAEQAASVQAKFEAMMSRIQTLLDEEFPGWEEAASAPDEQTA